MVRAEPCPQVPAVLRRRISVRTRSVDLGDGDGMGHRRADDRFGPGEADDRSELRALRRTSHIARRTTVSPGGVMHAKMLVAGTALAVMLGVSGPSGLGAPADDAAQAALTGIVSSKEEGKMEGVVVNARRHGATFTVSVVSDAAGRYSFPRTHLEPGRYTLTIRAVGYDLVNPGAVDLAAKEAATRDLSLQKTRDLASQLSSLEWIQSAPGTAEQKDKLVYQPASCAYCHSLERVMKSKHTAEKLVEVMHRMQTYYYDGTAISRDNRGRAQKGTPQQVD